MKESSRISKTRSQQQNVNKSNHKKSGEQNEKKRIQVQDKYLKSYVVMLRSLLTLLQKKIFGKSSSIRIQRMKCAEVVRKFKNIMEYLTNNPQNKQNKSVYKWFVIYFREADPQNTFKNEQFIQYSKILKLIIRSFKKQPTQDNIQQQKKWFKKFIQHYGLFKDLGKKQKPVLRHEVWECPVSSCRTKLKDGKCTKGNHLISHCINCGWCIHNCRFNEYALRKSKYQSYFDIIRIGKILRNFKLERLPPALVRNNIKKTVQQLQYQYTIEQKIIPGTPLNIVCGYPLLPKQAVRQIYLNRQQQEYLPLNIRQSTVPGAGLGVFATKDIPEGVLVCSYIGQIGIGSKTPVLRKYQGRQQTNNSIFTLGWLQHQVMIIAPNMYSNVGRFINYNKADQCNLEPSICLLERQKYNYEIGVILVSIREIKAGEQLFYDYGDSYSSLDGTFSSSTSTQQLEDK